MLLNLLAILKMRWVRTAFLFLFLCIFQELDLLEVDAPVFKLIGPVLMKQDLEEAKQNVGKRLELIEREM